MGPCAGGDRDTRCNAGMHSPNHDGVDTVAHCRPGPLARSRSHGGRWFVGGDGLVVLMVRGLPGVGRLRLVDVSLILAAIATAVAWLLRDRTGDGPALTSTAGTPVVMCAVMVAGAAAVVFSFNAGGRRA